MSMNIKQWVKAKQSEDFVKQALGVERLTGDALKNHPNYAFYLKFMTKAENHKLDKWLKDEVSTYRAWLNLGLLDLSFDLSAAQLKDTHAFKTYVRYATMYDNKMWRTLDTLSQPPIYYEGSPVEHETKVQVWAKARRPKEYVKKMLGLDLVPANAVKSQPDYNTFRNFCGWLRGRMIKDGSVAVYSMLGSQGNFTQFLSFGARNLLY